MALSTPPNSPDHSAGKLAETERTEPAARRSAAESQSVFEPSTTLKSRSFLGLVLSQFLAAFNDQASHIVAFFYATDMLVRFVGVKNIDTKFVVSVVTACFITPFFLFSPLAGVLADKYSKRNIVVFWKLVEVGIMSVALLALLLPHFGGGDLASQKMLAVVSSVLMVSIVFLMGSHSAFFVPAKYGMMPEILHTSILSRGNGLLEGTSFVANILGTVFGGVLYSAHWVKSHVDTSGAQSVLHPGNEWVIGLTLLILAIIGAAASLLIARIPAAAPQSKLVLDPWTPMKHNLSVLKKSRPLIIAAVGIAFFSLMTLYLRQSLLFQGETVEEIVLASRLPKPPAAEAVAKALAEVKHQNGQDDDQTEVPEKPTETNSQVIANAALPTTG
ncbi:MAG TPA: MFS transporter, partial [Pirellulales bacterium]